ncbi:anhydro-N-acetylmuramic acid kinase [Halieaceae bacterium IMCC14734]|uniref:Anhydro-N-acetylmuramic acid kinase n=1 Tax=Candidatus Litorirhabdus singularis TaxID=2518993 RepID=A0ABT3TLZ8_9GAMM|nr:anhydro-N-acetylmuramic acid kinase [Candidatus Litorirhabdus singularis]MCX2983318.1 anhydro-N-acetylmuramic acid kinase [Candidatus Litorirhabdus singularis]
MKDSLLLGLMSGTSLDAVDAAVLKIGANGMSLQGHLNYPIPPSLRAEIAAISHAGDNEIERLGRLDRQLGELFAAAALALLEHTGILKQEVRAIGSHGQTIRHRPPSAQAGGPAFTLQIGDPNCIAELTGITTVADFRRRDIAAGGEGAPLAPAFHAAAFHAPGILRACVNIGGLSNVSLLDTQLSGFDTGPGNTLLDAWIARHKGQAFDNNGAWAARGQVSTRLLEQLLQHPYLHLPPPKSTGKEDFNLNWLDQQISVAACHQLAPVDVQATLTEYTALTISECLPATVQEVYMCGGGALNSHLMQRLQAHSPTATVTTTGALGIDPQWVEAAAFAWLAFQCLEHLPGNNSGVTGASGPRVLGGVFPA